MTGNHQKQPRTRATCRRHGRREGDCGGMAPPAPTCKTETSDWKKRKTISISFHSEVEKKKDKMSKMTVSVVNPNLLCVYSVLFSQKKNWLLLHLWTLAFARISLPVRSLLFPALKQGDTHCVTGSIHSDLESLNHIAILFNRDGLFPAVSHPRAPPPGGGLRHNPDPSTRQGRCKHPHLAPIYLPTQFMTPGGADKNRSTGIDWYYQSK